MLKIILGTAAAAFLLALGVTIADHDPAEFFALLDDHWMQIVLADFYLGILCFTAVVWVVEGSVVRTLAWGLATCCLGNPVAALWLIVSGLPKLSARVQPAPQ